MICPNCSENKELNQDSGLCTPCALRLKADDARTATEEDLEAEE